MAEGLKIRLVRCPKCDNLLPENPDYSVYKCGGCGVVLQAKKKALVTDVSSVISDDDKGTVGSENLDSFTRKDDGLSVGSPSETERATDGIDLDRKEEVEGFKERDVNLIASSSPRTEITEVLSDIDRNSGNETMDQLDQSSVERDIEYRNGCERSLKDPIGDWVHGDGSGVNINRSKLVDLSVEKETGEIMHPNGNVSGFLRSSEITHRRWGVERDGREEFRGNSNAVGERGRFSAFVHPDEGPSNYHPGHVYGYGGRAENHDCVDDGSNRVEHLEQDRAELRRKLHELKDQMSRSCNVADNPKETVPIGRRMVPPDHYGGHDTYTISSQPSVQGPNPPYFYRSHGPVNRQDIDMQNFYPPPRCVPNGTFGYEDPFRPQLFRKPPLPPPWQYPSRPSYNNFLESCTDISQDPLTRYPHETCYRHPSSPCLQCDRKWQVPPQFGHTVSGNINFQNDATNPNFYHPRNFVPQGYNSNDFYTLPLHFQDPRSHKRRPNDLDSDFGGINQYRPRRVVLSYGNKRLCRPLSGGAPFITCYKCLQLLKLPRRVMVMEKNRRRLQCGACSTIILLEVVNEKLIVYTLAQIKRISVDVDDDFGEALNKNRPSSHGFSSDGGENSCTDFGSSVNNLKSTDIEANLLSSDMRLNMSESEHKQGIYYSSSISSVDEESPDSVIIPRDVSRLAELSSKEYISPPLSASPLNDICSSNQAANRFGKGSKSKRTDQEKAILNHSTSRQNTVKEMSPERETEVEEVSVNEHSIVGLSQVSVEEVSVNEHSNTVSKTEDRPKINKVNRSFFTSLIKKSFRDFSRSSQSVDNVRADISVNGNPISHRVVVKAEKLAGPIQAGEYWYDFRAGFWGVMGQPCHGIIPPYIQEFDYPMPEKCAAGNTGVYVNGRELHQNDLDLLVSRGLPTTRNKSYIIDITGKVVDEESSVELDSIGKLAPTVESTRRGFGMKAPKVTLN